LADKESVDKICEQIQGDGAKEVDSIIEKAKRTAGEIIAKAESEAKKVGERIVSEAAEKGELAKKRTLSSVSLEVRRIKLKAREEVVNAAMDAVRRNVGECRKRKDYPQVLAGLVAEALRMLEGDEFVVYADARDTALLESAVFGAVKETMKGEGRTVKRIEAKALPEATMGGVQVGVPHGNVIYDNTFEARMYRFKDDIRAIIFEGVFSSGDKIE
jgi:V/A-type H+-transporting ATPase subunit E